MMDDVLNNWQEWLTVFTYLGLTVIVIWGIFRTSGK